jgi:large subunit ribosomal protein L24
MQKIKVNDEVVVIAGKDKGKKGKVTKLNLEKGRVFVSGVNSVKKTVKPTQENPSGGIVDKEMSLDISNIALVSPKNGKATRVKIEERNGKRVRVAVKCGTVIE